MAQSIGMILQQWADMDIFYYALPFLLIFALVFAILQKVKIMGGDENKNRGINAVIALVVALMALQFDQVPIFFQIVFPKLGMALAALLVVLILIGLFADFEKRSGPAYVFLGVGGVLAVLVLITSLSDYSWWTGSFWQDNISAIIAGVIIVVFVVIVVNSGKTQSKFFEGLPVVGGAGGGSG